MQPPQKRGRGRPAKPALQHWIDGTFVPSRHGQRLADEMGVATYEDAKALLAVAPPTTTTTLPATATPTRKKTSDLTSITDLIGLSPRRRMLRGDDPGTRTEGPWVADFTRRFCVHTEGPFVGQPFELESYEADFLDEGLAFDDNGRRLYSTIVLGVSRKNGKTTFCSSLGLALGSPAEGEARPQVVLAAGSKEQAGPLYEQTTAFINANDVLAQTFQPLKSSILCEENGGRIWRVSADGKLQHGLNPYVVIGHEIHAWVTPKQEELWNALKTAQGAREDALVVAITTAGWDLQTILGLIYKSAKGNAKAELRPEWGPGGFRLADTEQRVLVHWYGVKPDTPFDDLDAYKGANPAPWRTKERIASDLLDPFVDESAKRRLYGNAWSGVKTRWISDELWKSAQDPDGDSADPLWIPQGARIFVGGDAALKHDTTAIGWAHRLGDGRVKVRARVWAAREDVPHHVLHPGRIDNEEAEAFIREELADRYSVAEFVYDPTFLEDEAKHLSNDGILVADIPQSSRRKKEAAQAFFKGLLDGRILHDGDEVLAAHVASASARKTEDGWDVKKLERPGGEPKPIDALMAVMFASWRALREETAEPWVVVLG